MGEDAEFHDAESVGVWSDHESAADPAEASDDWEVVEEVALPAGVPSGAEILGGGFLATLGARGDAALEETPEVLACKELMAKETVPFFAFAKLLSPEQQRAVWSLFAACHAVEHAETVGDLERTRQHLHRAFRGEPCEGVWAALQGTVRRFAVPRRPFDDLVDGIIAQVDDVGFETHAELLLQSYRRAGVFGLISLPVLAETVDAEVVEAAMALGMALYLTDALNCVGHHRRTRGTCTIPRALLLEHKLEQQELDASLLGEHATLVGDPRWEAIMRELMEPVRPLLRRAERGGEKLAGGSRLAVRAAVRMCRRVVGQIEARKYDSITLRAKMFSWRVAGDVAGALFDD